MPSGANLRKARGNCDPAVIRRPVWTSRGVAIVFGYPFAALRRRRPARNVVVELAVEYSVPNISDYTVDIRRMRGSDVIEGLGHDAHPD